MSQIKDMAESASAPQKMSRVQIMGLMVSESSKGAAFMPHDIIEQYNLDADDSASVVETLVKHGILRIRN